MNLNLAATKFAGASELFLKRNGPTMLTGAGVIGFIATTVLTARATAKAVDILPQISKDVAEVKNLEVDEDFSERDKQKALVKVYFKSSEELGKVYWPVLITGSVSIVCVISAHGMMLKRQASLVAAYTALDAGFKAYRKRVAEKLGEEDELKLYRSPRTIQDPDEETSCIIDMDDTMPSPYARFFDETSVNWTKTPEYNLLFLRGQQDWANDRLRAHGHLFLNEVYDGLGLTRSQSGQIVGWKWNEGGDNYVDFGLYQIGDECNRAFVNGIEHTVLLDFNVDGPISI
jgi:hypothetical protein